ncbi:Rieske (2Fe-2S) protein [Halopelagius longus]|uniref:Ferredoxin subunit of nitrite reductase or a ring-hydroxylating dioxygenase n=1 Tax=Halopelagius longus TaxID=1236180 RepID=A0A1H1GVU2_9EURY|nr:Rieske (2Fe-2S) protein [Halopelagius longus]SDR17193.1 Ferredoxin subunit of nitrite reductase or a ring-hydroxylating dioxygenase [Halopelagius longus]
MTNNGPEHEDIDTSYHYVLSAKDIRDNGRVIVDIAGREIVVAAVDDNFVAFSNYCPHQGGPLGEGRISGRVTLPDEGGSMSDMVVDCETSTVACPWHGWCFETESGEHIGKPANSIPTYDVVEREGDVYVSL